MKTLYGYALEAALRQAERERTRAPNKILVSPKDLKVLTKDGHVIESRFGGIPIEGMKVIPPGQALEVYEPKRPNRGSPGIF